MTKSNQSPLASKLTIGIPVYNGELLLRKTLESVLSQSYAHFNVIVSDNASTDTTSSTCTYFAEKDSRISYVRQRTNIGAFENFKFILNQCESEYFVFLAADDLWFPDFLKKNIGALENNSKAVCSVSRVAFVKNGEQLHESSGTYSLDGSTVDNLKNYFLRHPNDNSRFYGIFKTQILRNSFQQVLPFHALDWYLMADSLLSGTHIEVDDVLMHREVAEYERYMRQLNLDSVGVLSRIFPVLEMTRAFMRLLNHRQKAQILWPLLRLNLIMSRIYIKTSFQK